MITETFNLLSQLKFLKKEKLLIDIDDEKIMKKYFLKYRIYKYKLSYKKWRTEVIYNSITCCIEIDKSCLMVLSELKLKKNDNDN